jgi:formylglycine-generating enzyme required for sulfatase activity
MIAKNIQNMESRNHILGGQNVHSEILVVGQKEPNGWGLYDMNGNVWQ